MDCVFLNLVDKKHSEYQSINEKLIIKWILRKDEVVLMWIAITDSEG
jgi:hypothetical protein